MDGSEAFRAFVASASPRLMRMAFLLTGDVGEAEDAVQTTLIRVYLSWERIQGRGSDLVLQAYARRTLLRVVSTWRRRRHVRQLLTAEVPERAAVADALGSLDRTLLVALRSLPTQQRAAVVLRFLEDQSEQQVADLLGISVGTVKQHTHRALNRLRAELDREGAS